MSKLRYYELYNVSNVTVQSTCLPGYYTVKPLYTLEVSTDTVINQCRKKWPRIRFVEIFSAITATNWKIKSRLATSCHLWLCKYSDSSIFCESNIIFFQFSMTITSKVCWLILTSLASLVHKHFFCSLVMTHKCSFLMLNPMVFLAIFRTINDSLFNW